MRQLVVGLALMLVTASGNVEAQTSASRDFVFVTGAQHASQRGSFVPESEPYTVGPSVSVYLPTGQDVRTAEGLPIIGFSFRGWAEGTATRVLVSALVPQSGAPAVDLRYRSDLLEPRDFASYRISAGETIAITEMRDLGIEPIQLTSRSFQDLFAEMQRLSDALQKR